MKIYLDFDGTVVEHEYPKMGRCNFGCFEVIKKLQDAGHEIVLNTYRSDLGDEGLEAALNLVNHLHINLIKDRSQRDTFTIHPIQATEKKIHPSVFDMGEVLRLNELFIDDMAANIPCKPAVMSRGLMVDWDALDVIFQEFGLYNKVS